MADLLWARIADRKPFSFIRLGDGEGSLAAFSENSRLDELNYLEKHFGPTVSIKQIGQLRNNLEEAIASADLIGVRDDVVNVTPQAASLDPENALFCEQFKSVFPLREVEKKRISPHSARRIFQLYQRVGKGLPAGADICSQWVCYDLAKEGFWERLLASVDRMGLITSSKTLEARLTRRFAASVNVIVVPQKYIDKVSPVDGPDERHFPDAYQRVRALLARPLDGQVFLVGAGLAGKHYLHLIKQNGGIALDVGALLDAWDGVPRRGLIYAAKTPLQASSFSAPADYRLGAGRLASVRTGRRPALVFHAGFSRTATTAVQTAFAHNQQAFFELGVNYIKAGRGNAVNHHELARAFGMGEAGAVADRPKLAVLLSDIAAEMADHPDTIHVISSELFTNTSPNPGTEDDLIAFLNRYEVKFVATVRNQFDWLLSWYGKAASNRNMEMPLGKFLIKPPPLEKFDGNFLRKIDWFEKYLPAGSVRVISYDEHRCNPLSAFADAAAIPTPSIKLGIENASPSPSRIVSGVVARRLDVPIKQLQAVHWPPDFVDEFMLLGSHQQKREALRVEVMKRFEPINVVLRERYGALIGDRAPCTA